MFENMVGNIRLGGVLVNDSNTATTATSNAPMQISETNEDNLVPVAAIAAATIDPGFEQNIM